MTGYETFALFNSLKLHFNRESYDYFKYNGKSNISVEAFENRRDKYHFHKLSRKYTSKDDMELFFVSNLVEKPNTWAGDLLTEEADINYKTHQKVLQSLSYFFENDCHTLFDGCDNPNDLFKVNDGDYPVILRKTMQKVTQIETLCILNKILCFEPNWNARIADTIRWPEFRLRLLKYATFLPQDVLKYKLILKKMI
jgi:hypothetical protein